MNALLHVVLHQTLKKTGYSSRRAYCLTLLSEQRTEATLPMGSVKVDDRGLEKSGRVLEALSDSPLISYIIL